MSREVEDLNRRLLRARDAMDRAYAEALEVRAVGFTSSGTFRRTFREIVGETASDYRVGHGPMAALSCFQDGGPAAGGGGGGGEAIEQFSRSRRGAGSLP